MPIKTNKTHLIFKIICRRFTAMSRQAEFIRVLPFINYCVIFHTSNCEPTFWPTLCISINRHKLAVKWLKGGVESCRCEFCSQPEHCEALPEVRFTFPGSESPCWWGCKILRYQMGEEHPKILSPPCFPSAFIHLPAPA